LAVSVIKSDVLNSSCVILFTYLAMAGATVLPYLQRYLSLHAVIRQPPFLRLWITKKLLLIFHLC